MSFGVTIEQGTYANEMINYCQRVEFYEFFSQFGEIETKKRYFYTKETIKKLIDFLKMKKDATLHFFIECLEEGLQDDFYMVYFG